MKIAHIGRHRACMALLLATIGALAIEPAPLRAQDSAPPASHDTSGADPVSIDGFVSASYSYNINRPLGRTNALRVFDFDDGDFKIDVAEIVLQKPAEHAGDAGFRI